MTAQLARRLAALPTGWVGIGAGIALLLTAGLGAAPYDVASQGLARQTGLAVGTSSILLSLGLVAGSWLLGRRPQVGTFAALFSIGLVINVTLDYVRAPETTTTAAIMATVGLASVLSGAALTIASNLGPGALELATLALADRGLGVTRARWLIEGVTLAAGWVLGGVVGVYTVIILAVSGPALARLIPIAQRLVGTTTGTGANLDDGNTDTWHEGDLAGR